MAKQRIGKYDIIEKIGQGGMGAVYKANHPTLKRKVILKQLILKNNASVIERFKREARIMMDLRHDHIVQVYDHFKEGSSYFIAMEYVDGIALDNLVKEKRYLVNSAALLIFMEICKGLKYAHDKGVVHRDIKPANILISKDGEVKIADFGIATSKEDAEVGLTRTGSTLGSPAYMSPEQINDAKSVDRRADIYSMGVLLYNMVTGKLPFACNISPDTISKIEKGQYTSAKKINPKIKPMVAGLIKKTMHRKKRRRIKDAGKIIKIISKQFKIKNKNLINKAIKDYIYKDIDPTKTIKTKKGSSIKSFFCKLLPVSLILVFLFFAAFKLGYYQEYVNPGGYGAFKISIESIEGLNLDLNNDINAQLFYQDDKGEYLEYKNLNIKFKEDLKNKTKKSIFLNSGKIYLTPDNYRLVLKIRNKSVQRDFYLESRKVQKKDKKTFKYQDIRLSYKNEASLPLRMNFKFVDINSGKDISGVDIKVKYGSGWMSWSRFVSKYKKAYVTSREYFFEFEKNGYMKENYSVFIPAHQTNFDLRYMLVPEYGKIKIKNIVKGYKILLNNSNSYFTAGRERKQEKILLSGFDLFINKMKYNFIGKDKGKYANIQREFLKEKELPLEPGEYTLTVIKGSIKAEKKIKLKSNDMETISIEYNEKEKSIKLK